MSKNKEKMAMLNGAYAGFYTPAMSNGLDVDFKKFRELVNFVLDAGFEHGIGTLMTAGGAGEGYFLIDEEWKELIKITAQECKGKAATIAGVFDRGLKGALDKILFAEEQGIDFIQLSPPHNQHPTDIEIYDYFKTIDEAVSKIGILLYHTHWDFIENYQMRMPLLKKITDLDSVLGIKWHTMDLSLFTEALQQLHDKVSFIDNSGWVSTTAQNQFDFHMFMSPSINWDPEVSIEAAKLFIDKKYQEFVKIYKPLSAPKWAVVTAVKEEMFGAELPGYFRNEVQIPLWCSLGEGTVNKAIVEILDKPLGPAFKPQYQLSDEGKEKAKKIIRNDPAVKYIQ